MISASSLSCAQMPKGEWEKMGREKGGEGRSSVNRQGLSSTRRACILVDSIGA